MRLVFIALLSLYALSLPRSCARSPGYFFLDEKVTKKSSHPEGFLPHLALCAANQLKPKARSFCRYRSMHRFRQNYQCLCSRTPKLVLPDFVRSCPYDGLGQK